MRYNLANTLRILRKFIDGSKLYVSFDIDVFDASIVAATGYAEENGMNEREVMDLILHLYAIFHFSVFTTRCRNRRKVPKGGEG